MAKDKQIGFEALGGLVFSTNRELDLSPESYPIHTPEPPKQLLKVFKDTSGRKGKVVSIVDGFAGSEQDLDTLAKDLKKHCGTGGSAKDGQIIIQGELVEKIKAYLTKNNYRLKK